MFTFEEAIGNYFDDKKNISRVRSLETTAESTSHETTAQSTSHETTAHAHSTSRENAQSTKIHETGHIDIGLLDKNDKVQVEYFLKSDTFVIPPISKDKNNISFPRRLLDVELKNGEKTSRD